MACKFTIDYTRSKTEMIRNLETAILNQHGLFQGDENNGEFSFSTMGFTFRGNYVIEGDLVAVEITNKPFLVSCAKIESEIKKYMESDQEQN